MLPSIALVGRPNVGKSTLFNRLTRSQDAVVADFPGLTRDRQYGLGKVGEKDYWVIDTGGIGEPTANEDEIHNNLAKQVGVAIDSADHIFFIVDAKTGLTNPDFIIAKLLRTCGEKLTVVINKADSDDLDLVKSDFYQLGFERTEAISAMRKRGVRELVDNTLTWLAATNPFIDDEPNADAAKNPIKFAILGRPNVGKSTLTNALLGEERVVVSNVPGTTRDSISIPFEHHGSDYLLIDTAGIRRRTKIRQEIEQHSIWQAIQAIDTAHVMVLVIDARDGITDQDMRLINLIITRGKGLVLAFNKWDGMDNDARDRLKKEVDRKLPFAEFARRYYISALHGTGIGKLYHPINEAYTSANKELGTGFLTKVLNQALTDHQPPLVSGRRIKLRMAHLAGHHPLTILIHGKQTKRIPGSYKRYLVNYFRKACQLVGVPLVIRFQTDDNPYA